MTAELDDGRKSVDAMSTTDREAPFGGTTWREISKGRPGSGDEQLDLVWGAEAIGASLGISTRRTYYLLENREIPGRKVGGRWVVRRSRLGHFFDHSP